MHQISFAIAAKAQAAFPSPIDWNNFANFANIDLFNYYNDVRKASMLDSRHGHTENMPNALKVFVANEISVTFASGIGVIPIDQSSNLQLSVDNGGIKTTVKKVDFTKRENYLNSTIDTPSLANPIYCESAGTMLIYPTTITQGYLTYLTTPQVVKWAYTLTGNRPVYDSVNSVSFEWQPIEAIKILSRILGYMSIQGREPELEQYAERLKQEAS